MSQNAFSQKADHFIEICKLKQKYNDAEMKLLFLTFLQIDDKDYQPNDNLRAAVFAKKLAEECYHENLPAFIKFMNESLFFPNCITPFQVHVFQNFLHFSEKRNIELAKQAYEQAKKECEEASKNHMQKQCDLDEAINNAKNLERDLNLANAIVAKLKSEFEETSRNLRDWNAKMVKQKHIYDSLQKDTKEGKIKEIEAEKQKLQERLDEIESIEIEKKELLQKLNELEEKKKNL